MAGSLEGPLAKLARGEGQVGLLKREIEAIWPPSKAWPVRAEKHRRGREYRFYLGELPGVDPAWALWAGEIMFDLRSALDNLAFELHARRFRKRTFSDELTRRIQFPIFSEPSGWRSRGYRRIKDLGKRDRRAITHVQPYITRHDRWHRTRQSLRLLNELHNADKHRQLHLVTHSHNRALKATYPAAFGWQSEPAWGPVKSHGHIDTWTFAKPPPGPPDYGGAYLEITLEPEGQYGQLIPLLESLVDSVGDVLARFADRFPPTNPEDWPPRWRLMGTGIDLVSDHRLQRFRRPV